MESVDYFSYLFKFLIVGRAGAGKTCILKRYTEGKFIPNIPHTVGAEFGSKIIRVDDTPVKIQIWDTAGQERFRSMARSYYHDAVGCLLVFDITDRDSFTALTQWLNDVKQLASPEVVTLLVGNKSDLQDSDGQITHWEADAFAKENDLQFIETSASTGTNVEEAFMVCARSIVNKIKCGQLDPNHLAYGRQQGVFMGDRLSPLAASGPAVGTYRSDCSC